MKEDNIVHLYLSFNKRTSKFYISFIDPVNLEQNGSFYFAFTFGLSK